MLFLFIITGVFNDLSAALVNVFFGLKMKGEAGFFSSNRGQYLE
jgi:hypothetical protein